MTASPAAPLALITNDDGIDSPGLLALARCAVEAGWDVLVAAPAAEASGTGSSLFATEAAGRVVVRERALPGLEAVETYAVAAHPALIALVALRGGFGRRPSIVLSGINRGANTGRAVLHSGTVGAALTAGINGARALAVSVKVGPDERVDPPWDVPAAVVTGLLPTVAGLDAGTVLNLNVPHRPLADIGPPRWAPLSTYGRATSRVHEIDAGVIEVAYVTEAGDLEPGTDADLLEQGFATLTPLRSVSEDADQLAVFAAFGPRSG